MGKLFDMDNGIFGALGKMADLMILNIVFLFTCIPIITIGPAMAAMYEVTLKMARNEESYIVKGYLKAMKTNFKKGLVLGIIVDIIVIILILDFWIVISRSGFTWSLLTVALLAIGFLAIVVIGYIFPMQAKFENTVKNILKNSVLISIAHLPSSIMIAIINCSFPLCFVVMGTNHAFFMALMFFGVIGFALVAYMNSTVLIRIFEKYYPKEEEEEQIEAEV